MTKTIWKYSLLGSEPAAVSAVYSSDGVNQVALQLPKDSRLLHVTHQNGLPVVYALVDPEAELEARNVWLVYTGAVVPPDCVQGAMYLGTFHVGPLVVHAFGT